jgi:hypothetical protein
LVLVDVPGVEPVRVEVTPRSYRNIRRRASRERTTVADLLRPTELAAVAARPAHPTDTAAHLAPDERDTPETT